MLGIMGESRRLIIWHRERGRGSAFGIFSNLARLDIRITWQMRWEVGEVAPQ